MQNEIRFVLVEDEPLILAQLEHSICACNPRFRVVGRAGNGKDGLSAIERHRPDVVIADIQMPVLSGLDMIAAAREKELDTRFLVLSGYSEFQYARSALQLGVYDYLLKPIDPDVLSEKLGALAADIDGERIGRRAEYLRAWFAPGVRADEMDALPGGVCYFLFGVAGATATRAYSELSPGAQFWKENDFAWLGAIESRWAVHIEHFDGNYANEHVFAVVRPERATSGSMRALAEELLGQCHTEVPVCMIVTEPMQSPEEFVQQLRGAAACRMMAVPFGSSGVWCMGEDRLQVSAEVLPSAFCALAAQLVEQSQSHPEPALDALVSYWTRETPCEAVLLRQLEYLLGRLKDGGSATDTLTAEELLADAAGFADVAGALRPFLRGSMPMQDGKSGASAQISEIKRYIDENFDKALSYRVLYEKFGYNEKYIAYLFKKELGVSPSKYIVSVRIEAAKRLLAAQPGMLLKDAAQQVGFSDPLYFSRVFRDVVGVSPSRFAKEKQQNR